MYCKYLFHLNRLFFVSIEDQIVISNAGALIFASSQITFTTFTRIQWRVRSRPQFPEVSPSNPHASLTPFYRVAFN